MSFDNSYRPRGANPPANVSRFRNDDEGRECADCGIFKPWSNFGIYSAGLHGHCCYCKPCVKRKQEQKRKRYCEPADEAAAFYKGLDEQS